MSAGDREAELLQSLNPFHRELELRLDFRRLRGGPSAICSELMGPSWSNNIKPHHGLTGAGGLARLIIEYLIALDEGTREASLLFSEA